MVALTSDAWRSAAVPVSSILMLQLVRESMLLQSVVISSIAVTLNASRQLVDSMTVDKRMGHLL